MGFIFGAAKIGQLMGMLLNFQAIFDLTISFLRH
jgi:hypothetical protein